MALLSDGFFTGTPTEVGTWSFTVQARWPDGRVDVGYGAAIEVRGGKKPYVFSAD